MTSCVAEAAQSVSVVDLIKVPFQLVLGSQVGQVLQKVPLFTPATRSPRSALPRGFRAGFSAPSLYLSAQA